MLSLMLQLVLYAQIFYSWFMCHDVQRSNDDFPHHESYLNCMHAQTAYFKVHAVMICLQLPSTLVKPFAMAKVKQYFSALLAWLVSMVFYIP